MAVVKKGSFTLNLGLVQLGAELSDDDRQCAWELYTELVTRVAVTGKRDDPECTNFDGELYVESLNSLYSFFKEARLIMRKFPVGKIDPANSEHLGVLINRVLSDVLRPFLEKWQVDYRHWYESLSDKDIPPIERQQLYPKRDVFLEDWSSVRWLMRELMITLVKSYSLVDVDAHH